MNKKLLSYLGFVLLAIGFTACVDSESTVESILEKDKKAIEEYLAANPLTGPKDFVDEVSGFRVIWQELSNSGRLPVPGDTVQVNYVGKLLNGRVFDTSIESVARDNNIFSENRNYIPLRFILGRGQLIEGFESAIAIMEAGDKATVIMPSLFGYGGAAQGDIPPNSPLIFELDFIDLKKGPQQ
ncbi:FKBP-type peptidyl-prolyl cis-trans isomerase [Algoriphagus formosus]|uniref:Peptidyl-prolyl cis-trans isomerase n=1 Tax=Algoriphagus formosus TaxID=2007308 RepID=A0A4R5UY92_9BACT|nr:FKBP-type peptidyl-prolyl cis-trans isomerase [Algoriphagus aquimaris]TDK44353.1 FKBP-type peptidyl-prolyl cis-trans isomerase [Algoriphagus aquimaris]